MSGVMGPMIAFSCFGLALAVYQLRLPRVAWITPDHLGLQNWFGYQRVAWSSITYAEQKAPEFGVSKKGQIQLVLRDSAGKLLVQLAGNADLVTALHREVTQRSPAAHTQPSQSPTFARRVRRKRWTSIITGAFLTLMGAAGTWFMASETLKDRRLENEGIAGNARIVKHYMFNVTPRVEIEITGPNGSKATKNVSMTQAAWTALEGQKEAPVRYVPDDPANARVVGQDEKHETQSWMIGGGVLMLLLGIGCFVMGLLGYDLVTRDGKFRLVTLAESVGRGLPERNANSPAPPPLPVAAYTQPISSVAPENPPDIGGPTPKGLRSLGVITALYGAAGLLLAAGGLLLLNASVVVDATVTDPTEQIVDNILQGVSGLASLGLLLGGLGMFLAKPWAFPAARFSSIAKIILSITMAIFILSTVSWGNVADAAPEAMEARRQELAIGVGSVMGGLMKLAFPLMLLALLQMPQVRATLKQPLE